MVACLEHFRPAFDEIHNDLAWYVARLREAEELDASRPTYSSRLREAARGRGKSGPAIMAGLKAEAARELPTLPDGEYRTFLLGLLDGGPSQHDARMDHLFGAGRTGSIFEQAESDDDQADPVWGGSANDRLFGKNDDRDPVFGHALALPAADRSDYCWNGRLQETAPSRPDHDYDGLFAEAAAGAVQAAPKSDPEMDCVFGTK